MFEIKTEAEVEVEGIAPVVAAPILRHVVVFEAGRSWPVTDPSRSWLDLALRRDQLRAQGWQVRIEAVSPQVQTCRNRRCNTKVFRAGYCVACRKIRAATTAKVKAKYGADAPGLGS